MRSLALGLLLLLLPAVAAADMPRYHTTLDARIEDPDNKVTVASLTDTVRTTDGTSLDACWKRSGMMTVKVVFEKGRAVSVAASGSGDRDAEVCVARVLRAVTLADSASRVAATINLVGVDRPPPKASLFEKRNRKVLDSVIDRNISTSLGKFVGIKGDVGTGVGTGTVRGTDSIGPVPPTREPKVDVRQRPTGTFNDRTAEEIQLVVVARTGVFRACYQKELARTPAIAGKLVVQFSIDPDGTVSRVQVDAAKTTLPSEPVISCIKANIARIRFPAKSTSSEVSYPIELSAGK